jgi:hypothetical protein
MKKEKENPVEEPYSPEDTPRPPQIIDPNAREEREHPIKDKGEGAEKAQKPKPARSPALGDEPDIHDETTI